MAVVSDTLPIPFTSTTGQAESLIISTSVTGGTLYTTYVRQGGVPGTIQAVAQSFVSTGTAGVARFIGATNAKSDAGVALTATATAGAMGISRTAGTSLALVGEATSSNAKTDKAIWQLIVSDSYVAGTNIPVVVNSSITGSGTLTGASCTMTVAAYSVIAGVETALTVSAAQQMVPGGASQTFTITGSGSQLVAGSSFIVELVMLITTASGANTGQVNSVSVTA